MAKTYRDDRDYLIEAMEESLKEWRVVWVDVERTFETNQTVRYAPMEFAYKFADVVADYFAQLKENPTPPAG